VNAGGNPGDDRDADDPETDADTDARRRLLAQARARLPAVSAEPALVEALCAAAAALGVDSPRAWLHALRAARAAAAFDGADRIEASHAAIAVRLVLAPRATRVPEPPADAAPPEPPQAEPAPREPPEARDPSAAPFEPPPEAAAGVEPPPAGPSESPQAAPPDPPAGDARPLEDRLLEAARAALPAGLLAGLASGIAPRRGAGSGRAGAQRRGAHRGRVAGSRPGLPGAGQRLALIDTLRAAAPWQTLRRRTAPPAAASRAAIVHRADLRVAQRLQRTETTTVFVVDASGSAALHRLAEAKGAVELLLADCYVRRDRVAVIAFRERGADVLLPPTRSLVRAKRSLAGLPGGGGTPLASGLDAATALVEAVRRRGATATLVVLTDGRANVARDGTGGRTLAEAQALESARRLRALDVPAVLVDTSPQPRPAAREIAVAMAARYVPMPHADARRMAGAVRAPGARGTA
jgi:magnesium chelatase subunit D